MPLDYLGQFIPVNPLGVELGTRNLFSKRIDPPTGIAQVVVGLHHLIVVFEASHLKVLRVVIFKGHLFQGQAGL